MSIQERQDIQTVNAKAEQLNVLMQTIHAHHEQFDRHQLDGLLGLAYDLAGSVYSWTEEEERIVLANEDAQRKVN
ncbi:MULTISPECIES: hypothetical protein [Enterobacter]|uniref:hypothetical protein n=1 Tax=Enterobacter TaxID=547 RepID=UPI0021C7A087|nr:hypothetical protein [Enterobacter mori]HDC4609882.1 hypothetical protein [Enterobacter kobei]MCU3988089.1 hypothetical protein [Enterobacter mori]HDC4625509.1 hypothetical protein [Enterobacter kobei]HDR2346416.1 hypothetical protein [Enterobacter kobei]HDR2360820.1 hypothetical protein [Enterobacter kobei]